ncbi:MAG TPA: hypothetical protein VK249_10505 [Anaerolineales bacterium]|nr:hypothetical protein [Anaerolineales bacterium]
MDYETFNQLVFGFFIILALILFYQSYVNLIKKQLTKFCLDALLLAYLRVRQGEKSLKRAKKLLINEPNRLRTLGIFAFVGGIAAMYQAIAWYIKYLQ